MKQLTPKQVQKIVDQFNRKVKIGDEFFLLPCTFQELPAGIAIAEVVKNKE